MTRRGTPEKFSFDPTAPTFEEENLISGKGLAGGNPLHRLYLPGYVRAPLTRPLLQVADLEPNGDGEHEAYRQRLAAFLAAGPLEIEIGFGDGNFLLDRARKHPERRFIGFELRWHLLRPALRVVETTPLPNLLLSPDDARFALARSLPPACASALHVLLPDPWWKRRHQHKRMFTPFTMTLLARALQPGGILHVRTDVEAYGALIVEVVQASQFFHAPDASLATLFPDLTPTTREAWCYEHGFPIYTFYFARRAGVQPTSEST